MKPSPSGYQWHREAVFIFDRGFADVKLMKYLDFMGAKFIIRARKNTGILVGGDVSKLAEFGQWGYFRNVLYHSQERIAVNLFCSVQWMTVMKMTQYL